MPSGRLILLLVAGFIAATGMAQATWSTETASMQAPGMPLPYRSLQVDEGLPSNQVLDLEQDAGGFLWLATPEGLARFDGLVVEPYGLNLSMPSRWTQPLVPLSNGHLHWSDGQQWHYWNGRSIKTMATDRSASPAERGMLMPDGRGSMLRLESASPSSPNASVYRWSENQWKSIAPPVGHSWNMPVPMGTGESHAWILDSESTTAANAQDAGRRCYLVQVDAHRARARPLVHCPLSAPGVLEWAPGRLLYASAEGPVLLDADGSERLLPAASARGRSPSAWPEDLRHWVLDPADRLWLAGDEARLYAFQLLRHPLSDSVALKPLQPLELDAVPTDLMLDRDGNLWWGTANRGAACLPASSAYVQTLTREDGLPDRLVRRLAAYPSGSVLGNIWTGHRAGLVGVLHQTGVGGAGQPIFGSAGIRPIDALEADALGQAWAATDAGVYRIRLRRVEALPRVPGARALAVSDERVFAGGENGLFVWPLQPEADMPLATQWHEGRLDALCSDGQGGCWAFGAGLLHADQDGLVRQWPLDRSPAPRAIDMARLGASGGLVLALRGEGLWWHPAPDRPGALEPAREASSAGAATRNGFLPLLAGQFRNLVLRDVFAEGDSVLWVASNGGLFRLWRNPDVALDPKRPDAAWSLRRYSSGDGLPSNDVHAVLVLDGLVYVGHQQGLSLFRPADLDRTQSLPGIRLTGIQVNGADTLLEPGAQLPHDQNRIQFAYRGIAPGHGHRLHYRYRLDGLDPPGRWNRASDLSVRYAHLSPGQYRFRVEAVDADGSTSLAPDHFAWTIVRPWWASTWFRILAVLLALMAVAGLYAAMLGRSHRRSLERAVSAKTLELDRKIRDLKRSNEQLEQFAFIASHDLKEPLRNVANYVQWIERRGKGLLTAELEGYLDVAVRGVKRMYGMLDGLLEWSALARESRPHRRVDGNALVQQVLQGLPAEGRVTILSEALPDAWGDPRQLGILLRQLVDNAIKFNPSPEANVHLYGSSRAEEVEWCVADNGPGLDERYADRVYQIFERLVGEDDGFAGHGVGLALCQRIVERHGGRLWYRRTPEGTTFHVTLPKAPDGLNTPAPDAA